jgi:Leucine-rich repeat (LRR) protein
MPQIKNILSCFFICIIISSCAGDKIFVDALRSPRKHKKLRIVNKALDEVPPSISRLSNLRKLWFGYHTA